MADFDFLTFELGGSFFSQFLFVSKCDYRFFEESFFCWRDGWIYWVYFVD